MPQLDDVLLRVVVEEDAPPDGVELHFGHVDGREEVLKRAWIRPQLDLLRLANDRRSVRLLDSEIIINFKILGGVVLRSVSIVPIIGWNRLELGNRVKKSGHDHDR